MKTTKRKSNIEYDRCREAVSVYFHDTWVGCISLWSLLAIATILGVVFRYDSFVSAAVLNIGIWSMCWLIGVLLFIRKIILCNKSLRDLKQGNIEKKKVEIVEVKSDEPWPWARGRADKYTRYILTTSDGKKYRVCPKEEFYWYGHPFPAEIKYCRSTNLVLTFWGYGRI